MAGYSGTPLAKKLGIHAGARIALIHSPVDFTDTLGGLPVGAVLAPAAGGRCDVVLLFVATRAQLATDLSLALRGLAATGGSGWRGPSAPQASPPIWRRTPCARPGWRQDW
jgi:hypothetical protein